ncbi:Type I restriction modification DNA specificity domain-containing protein [Chryseobacterium rhizoplanae]|uniref:Type I restriction modification DNA specificity domain-containing protein n=1 Tax=Chryseobacterium rhizoplanae TaxID=1609531 RepID=A0A521E0Y5_9FLAO|nr:restriction endonuclease subunit S [Chryseobacterium rhizoplanae]SMO77626.1 Type I restriction modification DNA specificity domain-containing protein [Chryseobacterium rhizoplanae]
MHTLSQHINSNKITIINRSNLEGRLDPLYYNSDLTKFNSGIYKSIPLRSVVLSFKSGIGAGKQDQAIDENGIIQIRPTNIDENGFLKFDKNVYLPIEKKIDRLEVGDVLFNNTNSQELVGKTAILKEEKELSYSNHITVLKPKRDVLLSEYLWIILNLYQKNKIFYAVCTNWNNQSGVGIELLKSLRIPLPPLESQKQIVEVYQSAYEQQKKIEEESEALLTSIDGYLLDKLGISLPEKDNSLKNRIFITQLRQVTGGRFDPKLYDKTTTSLKQAIKETDLKQFKVEKLRTFIVQSLAGDWGIEHNEENYSQEYEKCLVIRATEFDNDFNLKLDNSRVKFRLIKKDKISKIDIQENDLLIEKSGGSPDQPVGRIAILTKDILHNNKISYSNFIHKIRINTSILNPEYLFCYLKTIHNIKLTESMQSQTNGIRNLIMQNYFNQDIVVPILPNGDFDLEKQYEIANHIQSLRAKAMLLQQEAKNILDNVKQQVEQMILGNAY